MEMYEIKEEIKEEKEFVMEGSSWCMEPDSIPLEQSIIKNELNIKEEPQEMKEETGNLDLITGSINDIKPEVSSSEDEGVEQQPLSGRPKKSALSEQFKELKHQKLQSPRDVQQKPLSNTARRCCEWKEQQKKKRREMRAEKRRQAAAQRKLQANGAKQVPPAAKHQAKGNRLDPAAKNDWTRRVWQNGQVPGVVNRGSGNLQSAAFQYQPPGNGEAVRSSSAYGGHQQFPSESARSGWPRAFGNGGIPSAVTRDNGHTSGLAPPHFVLQGGDAGGHVGQRGVPGNSQFYYYPENQQFHNYHHHNYANFTGQDNQSRLNINNLNCDNYVHYFHCNDPSGPHGPRF